MGRRIGKLREVNVAIGRMRRWNHHELIGKMLRYFRWFY